MYSWEPSFLLSVPSQPVVTTVSTSMSQASSPACCPPEPLSFYPLKFKIESMKCAITQPAQTGVQQGQIIGIGLRAFPFQVPKDLLTHNLDSFLAAKLSS
jgi:hypothetical protein